MTALILLDFPTTKERQMKKFITSEHNMLFKALYDEGIDPTSLNVAYCINDDVKATAPIVREAKEKFSELRKSLKPDYVLACGDLALRVATKHRGITKYRGSVIDGVFPVLNPNSLEYNVHNRKLFKADIKTFSSLLKSERADYSDLYVQIIDSRSKFDATVVSDLTDETVAYDIETTGLDENKDKITMLGTCIKKDDLYISYVFMNDAIETSCKLLPQAGKLVAHNSRFDNKFINKIVKEPIQTTYDTMLGGYVIDESTPHSLKFLSRAHLNADCYEEGIDFTSTPLSEVAQYCAKDCYWTLKLREWQLNNLGESARILAHVVMPGARLLEKIHRRGVHIDTDVLSKSTERANELVKELNDKLDSMIPKGYGAVNYNSPTQLKKLLYEKFKYKPFKDPFTKKNDLGTGKAILKKYAREGSEFCKTLLDYRTYKKMLSGFLEPYTELTKTDTRIYPEYNIARTATGRLSSSNPNLQQISRDPMVRHLISAPKGKVFIECDYSQVELRVAAWIGDIESMKKLYKEGADIHTNTAKMLARIKGVDWSSLSKAEVKSWRTKSKAVNFGFIYGMSAQGFLDYADSGYDIVLSLDEAKKYRDAYFTLYPELVDWHRRAKLKARIDKKVVSPFGRVRHLDNISSMDSYERGKAERCALNSPVQSAASELTILSMILLDKKLDDSCLIVGQCHDAIFFECDEDSVDKNCKIIKDTMENLPLKEYFGVEMPVPLIAEPTVGASWGQGYDWVDK